jgi:flagellar biosynthesis/type III secretory pathway protein FliH
MNEDYPVFVKWYKTLDWILDKTEKYPRNVRYSLSGRINDISLDILEKIIEAIYSKKKRYILQSINLYIEKLRVLFRISSKRRYISIKNYEYISKELNETGKMIGGWLKICAE